MKYQNNFWNSYFKYYDVLLKVIPYQELFSKIASSLELNKKSEILDLGSGTGNLQYFLPEFSNVISLDNSKEALERLKGKFPNAKVVKHSIHKKLPFNDNTFDKVVSNNVLYTLHNEEWDFVVSEIQRVSKPESIIVISNLNNNFKAINIYKDHIIKSLRNIGLVRTSWELLTLIFPTIRMLQYNKKINENNKVGRYSFLNADEHKSKFEKYNLISLKETEYVYSGQANLNVFKNKKKPTVNKR